MGDAALVTYCGHAPSQVQQWPQGHTAQPACWCWPFAFGLGGLRLWAATGAWQLTSPQSPCQRSGGPAVGVSMTLVTSVAWQAQPLSALVLTVSCLKVFSAQTLGRELQIDFWEHCSR